MSKPGMTRQEAEAFAYSLADGERRPRPVIRWVDDSHTGQALRRAGRDVIVLGQHILDDAEDARFTVAHETGHIALGHTTGSKSATLLVAYLGPPTLAVVAIMAAVLTLRGPQGAGLAMPAVVVFLLIQAPLLKRLKQPQETAADIYAATHGGPLSAALAARYTARQTRSGRLVATVFPVHPSWASRAAAVSMLPPR